MKPVTLVLDNARIITLDEKQPEASALAIQGGTIVALGESSAIVAEFSDRAVREDMHGQFLIPGLTDAHFHLQHYALSLQKVNCETATQQECLQRVSERARVTQPESWILGHGWNQNNWPEGFGSAALLDRVSPNNPVYLTAKSLHAGWANSVALRLAHLSAETPDPEGGKLGRDSEGQLTGIVFESAMELITHTIPAPTPVDIQKAVLAALPILWQMGLTGVHDFDRKSCFTALQTLHQEETLQLRVIKSLPLEDLPYAAALGLRTGFGDDFLRIGSVKAFADGALGPHTAAMFQPYEDDPQNRGILMMDAEELYEQGRTAVENGLSLAVHAIGDRANHEVLDAFAQLRQDEARLYPGTNRRLRHRIEHVQAIHTDDARRLADLDIIASMQPIHATSDMHMADRYWGGRSALAYAWRTQIHHGARVAFGSDAPVESPNPFWGIHAAVTRQRPDGSPGILGWYPSQRLTVMEALQGFTTGAAYAAGMENRLGRLSSGYLADLLVLETNPFTCRTEELYSIQPVATMINGSWVWRS